MDLSQAKLRIARPTDRLETLGRFYREGLGFEELARFQDHDGFDGLVLGHPHAPYHLEFTHARGVTAGAAPGPEHLLVFYLPERADWLMAVNRLQAVAGPPKPAFNPYWDRDGLTFEDPDGYRIVLQNAAWRP